MRIIAKLLLLSLEEDEEVVLNAVMSALGSFENKTQLKEEIACEKLASATPLFRFIGPSVLTKESRPHYPPESSSPFGRKAVLRSEQRETRKESLLPHRSR